MIEGMLAWIMLFIGVLTGNPLYLIASAVYAVAARIWKLKGEETDA